MPVDFDEEQLRESITWKSVSEIPDFPFESFEELTAALESGTYGIGVDQIVARRLNRLTHDFRAGLLFESVFGLPLLIIVGAVVGAVVLRNGWLLFAIPVGLVAFFWSVPYHPLRTCITAVAAASLIGLLASLGYRYQAPSCLFASFLVTFLAIRWQVAFSTRRMRAAVSSSEIMFLYMYEKHAVTVLHIPTGKIHAAWPSMTGNR